MGDESYKFSSYHNSLKEPLKDLEFNVDVPFDADSKSASNIPKSSKESYQNIFKAFLLLVAATLTTFMFLPVTYIPFNLSQVSLKFSNFAVVKSVASIEIQLSSPEYGVLESASMHPWAYIAEPYKLQRFEISSFKLDGYTYDTSSLEDDYNVVWTFDSRSYQGSKVLFRIQHTGILDGVVQLTSKDNPSEVHSLSFEFASKYIRREIRSLSDGDRSKFFNALYTLYTVDRHTGLKRYGSGYQPMEYFLSKHLKAGSRTDCDHWHDGAGIMAHHLAITLAVEQSLQSIDKTISMPYWEFGMDSLLYEDWQQSQIFDSEWFGEASPESSNHQISDGSRWINIEFPSAELYKEWSIVETGSLNPYVNAFGLLRSPWNFNSDPHIGRKNTTYNRSQYSEFPSCGILRECFQRDTLTGILECSNGETHGPVHILIGGAWGDEEKFMGDLEFFRKPQKLLYFKVLWRKGITRCPTSCDDGEECRCSVPDEYLEEYGPYNLLKYANVLYSLPDYLTSYDEDDDIYLDILRAIESPGTVGDMFTSASSYDPTFWPLHGASERLLNYKRILKSSGLTDLDEEWGYPAYDKYSSNVYLHGRCDWSDISDATDLTLPACSSTDVCEGHGEDDELGFTNFLGLSESYTNRLFYDFTHPWNDELPYVYDSYSYDYCADAGYDFNEDGDYYYYNDNPQ